MSKKKRIKAMRITQLGEAVLRKKTAVVPKKDIAGLQDLVERMMITMYEASGVGIAANQVGVSKQLFIVAPQPNIRYPKAESLPPLVMINPKLLKASKRMVTDWEGCLSIPGLRALVPRHQSITVEFTDLSGKTYQAKMSDFVARIFQHEFDHINGRVYMDRVVDTRTYCMETILRGR